MIITERMDGRRTGKKSKCSAEEGRPGKSKEREGEPEPGFSPAK
jgi:hypothetical protein